MNLIIQKQQKKNGALILKTGILRLTDFYRAIKILPQKNLSSGVSLHEYTMNFELTRILNKGWSVTLNMPVVANEAKGALEHASGDYHVTHAYGIGDMRFTVFKWLLPVNVNQKGNIQFGLGIKFPTGNYQTQDYFLFKPN